METYVVYKFTFRNDILFKNEALETQVCYVNGIFTYNLDLLHFFNSWTIRISYSPITNSIGSEHTTDIQNPTQEKKCKRQTHNR